MKTETHPLDPTNQADDDSYQILKHCPICDETYNEDGEIASSDEILHYFCVEDFCSKICYDTYLSEKTKHYDFN